MKYPVKYKGFDIQIDVTQPFIGSGVQATYVCSRGSSVIFSGTIAGSFSTNEDAEREACKAAQRRIESKTIDTRASRLKKQSLVQAGPNPSSTKRR